jgi:hypothetical protein
MCESNILHHFACFYFLKCIEVDRAGVMAYNDAHNVLRYSRSFVDDQGQKSELMLCRLRLFQYSVFVSHMKVIHHGCSSLSLSMYTAHSFAAI